jgi:hypothetical protein
MLWVPSAELRLYSPGKPTHALIVHNWCTYDAGQGIRSIGSLLQLLSETQPSCKVKRLLRALYGYFVGGVQPATI